MPALLHEGAQRAGGERREIDRHQLRGDAAADERHQPGILRRRDRFGQQPQRKAREILAALAVAQPVGDERRRNRSARSLASTGAASRKCISMNSPSLSAMRCWLLWMIAVCGIGSPSGLLKQRHHGVPVGEAADRGGLGKGRDEAEHRMHRQQRLRARGRSQTSPPAPASPAI